MDRFKEISCFVDAARLGSLSAVARTEGVSPAIIGRRLDALEQRLGIKLLTRSTRRLTLTTEGQFFLEHCQRILADLANAEVTASQGRTHPAGHLKITAPAGFGRRYIAPIVQDFLAAHKKVSVSLELTDRIVDVAAEGFDCAIRFGEVGDPNLVAIRLFENQRVCVASPDYFRTYGHPASPAELSSHACLLLSHQAGWIFSTPDKDGVSNLRLRSRFVCSDGAVLRDWARAGLGIAWRSMWEIREDLEEGRLERTLQAFEPPPVRVHAVTPPQGLSRLALRLFIEQLQAHWQVGPQTVVRSE